MFKNGSMVLKKLGIHIKRKNKYSFYYVNGNVYI
jgi:hypothetical protein